MVDLLAKPGRTLNPVMNVLAPRDTAGRSSDSRRAPALGVYASNIGSCTSARIGGGVTDGSASPGRVALPRAPPVAAQRVSVLIWAAVSVGSYLYARTRLSANHGGMCRIPTACAIASRLRQAYA